VEKLTEEWRELSMSFAEDGKEKIVSEYSNPN